MWMSFHLLKPEHHARASQYPRTSPFQPHNFSSLGTNYATAVTMCKFYSWHPFCMPPRRCLSPGTYVPEWCACQLIPEVHPRRIYELYARVSRIGQRVSSDLKGVTMGNNLHVGDLENSRGYPDFSRVLGSKTSSFPRAVPCLSRKSIAVQ